jgi:large subunit ribosomal protein L15
MPHRLRKHRRMRGSRTQGYGRIGQHRDHGSSGYKKAGRHKALWSYINNVDPNYFGKHGFHSPQSLHSKENAINIASLDEMTHILQVTTKGQISIDLTSLGYTKLLGSGKISKALIITVASCSEAASKKILVAGGKVITEETIEAKAEQSGE